MRSYLTWIGIGLFAFMICLVRLRLKQETHLTEKDSATSYSAPKSYGLGQKPQLSVDEFTVKSNSIHPSPYQNTGVANIREAQSRNEPWSSHYRISDTWTVQLNKLSQLDNLTRAVNGEILEAVAGFENVIVLRVRGSEREPLTSQIRSILQDQTSVMWFEQEIIEAFTLRYDETPPPFSDPLLGDQWHLRNVGDRLNIAGEDSNIYPAWNQGLSGAGIHIAIVDTGTQGIHPDLAPNYRDDLDFDYLDNDSSAEPETDDETHGTSVSGVAAAAVNDICGVGAAFNAELIGVRLIHEQQGVSSSRQASAVSHRSDLVDIYNNSWGPNTDEGARMAGPGTLALSAMKHSVEDGRDGLGSIYVWSVGNGRSIGGNVHYDGWAAHRYTISVGAVGDHGKLSSYSEPGAPLLVCAPSNGNSSGIRTTDLLGQAGADPGDCRIEFGGTSSAAPLVAGIAALMLEANPNLSWRDVQHILAKTAVKVDPSNDDWSRNGAGYWVNHNFGFGRVDAAAAVKVAPNWIPVGEELLDTSNTLPLNQSIPDNSTAGIQAFHFVEENLRTEQVAVTLNMEAADGSSMDWGNLKITLTSPSGTKSVLAEPHTDSQKSYQQWTYWSVRHLDENAQGTWILEVKDLKTENRHVATSWNLDIYGTEITEQDNRLPVAHDDNIIIFNTISSLELTVNDTDSDGDTLEVISVYRSPDSSVILNESGLIEYTPGPGLKGRDRFGYTIHDGRGGIKTAEVYLTVLLPEANDDQVATSINESVVIPVLSNDIDYDGDNIRITGFSSPKHGAAEIQGFINIKYIPETGFVGVDRFTYTITDDKDGEATAEVTVYVTADNDYALLFDGNNDHVVLENTENQNFNTPFSIEAWIRPDGWGEGEPGYGRIFDKEKIVIYLHHTGYPNFEPESLIVLFEHSNGASAIYSTPDGSIRLNRWQHVAVTYDNISDLRIYIDGQEQTLSAPFGNVSGPIDSSNQAIMIGESFNQNRAFEGAIDELRIWNRALSLSEINDRKDNQLSGEEPGLYNYYSMNEGRGTKLLNGREPARNGNITEAKWIRGIIGENTPPTATVDEVKTLIDKRLVIPVTGNDSDPDGDELSIVQILHVSEGTASIQGGSIIYQPTSGFNGVVRIDYEIDDGYNGTTPSALILIIGEGLYYTAWEARNYAGGLGDAEKDSDLDTLSNFTEYAFGTNPLNGQVDPARSNLDFDRKTGTTIFTFTFLKNSLDVIYQLQQSADLINWSTPIEGTDYEILSSTTVTPDTETRTLRFHPADGNRVFLKLVAISLAGSQ